MSQYPPQQPPNQHMQYPPQYEPPPQWPPPQTQKHRVADAFIIGLIVFIILLIAVNIIVFATNGLGDTSTKANTDTTVQTTATLVPTVQPTLVLTSTPQSIHYPPTTIADLRGLATKGVASAIHEFHSESVGLTGICPQPKREVTVDSSVTGQQLAEDLLAYFYTQQLDSPCGSVVFAYHNQGEAGDVYTAGRILLDVTDSSGTENVDPNANNLKYTLTLDIGGAITNQQEYVITY